VSISPSVSGCCLHRIDGNAINITYSECVFVGLVIQHAKRMRRIVMCGLSGSTICFHVLPQRNTVMYQGFAGVHGVAVTFYLFASLRGADPPCCRFSTTLSSTSCSLLLVSLHATISWLSSSQRAQKDVRTFSIVVTWHLFMRAGKPTAAWISPRSEPNRDNVTSTPCSSANR
jgi:hypothetical protein